VWERFNRANPAGWVMGWELAAAPSAGVPVRVLLVPVSLSGRG